MKRDGAGSDGSSDEDESGGILASRRRRRRHRSGPAGSGLHESHANARAAEREALLLRAALKSERSHFMTGKLADEARSATLDILEVRADADAGDEDEEEDVGGSKRELENEGLASQLQ